LIFTNTSSKCHGQFEYEHIWLTLFLRISAANSGPTPFHQNQIVSWLMSMPRSSKSILNVAKRKQKSNIHHDGQTDDLWARLEVAKGAAFCHPATLISRPARLNKFSSDSARH
jgi:hypothetical protein